MLSKIPLSHSKYGITIMDKEQALQSFIESFYSNTELSRSAAAAMDQSGSSSVPLMITGEIGTGKDRVAYLHLSLIHISSFTFRTTVNSYLFILFYLLVVSGPCFQFQEQGFYMSRIVILAKKAFKCKTFLQFFQDFLRTFLR